MKTTSDT